MESLELDDATSVLLEPPHPRPDGRIIRMDMNYFMEIISMFRLANRDDQCSVGTECMDYSESVSLGMIAESAQQTSVKMSAVYCQTEAVNAKKLSSIVYPVQRTTVPVTAATATLVPESRSNVNGKDTLPRKGQTTGGVSDRKVLEVVCHQVSILKDLVRTIHRSQPTKLHEFVVLFADLLSQFCSQLTNSGRDYVDILKQFRSNVAKDFENKELWFTALKPDALISTDRENTRQKCSKTGGSRDSVERRPLNAHSYQKRETQRTTSHTKPHDNLPNKCSRSSHKRSRDDRSRSPSYKRPRVSSESKDSRSSKSNADVTTPAESVRHHGSTPTNKRHVKHNEGSRQINNNSINNEKSEARVINKSPDGNTGIRKFTKKDAKRVGCFKSSKVTDPRISKSTAEDFSSPYSPSSPSDHAITLDPLSNTSSKRVETDVIQSKCYSSKIPESKRLDHIDALAPLSITKTRSSEPVDSGKPSPTSRVVQTTLPTPCEPSSVLRNCEESSQQTNVRTSTNATASNLEQYTLTMISNLCKNYPYVEQPKIPSLKMVNICGKKAQPSRAAIASPDYIDEKSKDFVEVSCKKSDPLEIESLDRAPDVMGEKDCAVMTCAVVKSPLQISSGPAPLSSIKRGDNDCMVEGGDYDGVSGTAAVKDRRDLPMEADGKTIKKEIRPDEGGDYDGVSRTAVVKVARDLPMEVDGKTIKKEFRPDEDGVKSDINMADVVENEIAPVGISEDSDQRVYPKVSVLATQDRSMDIKQRESSSRNMKKPIGLRTFCIGSLTNWFEPVRTPSSVGKKPVRTPSPEGKNRGRTRSPDGKKRPQKNSPKYSRISTQITARIEESRDEPYYYNEQHDDAKHGCISRSQHKKAASISALNYRPTDRYHPPTFQSFGGVRDSMPNYGGYCQK